MLLTTEASLQFPGTAVFDMKFPYNSSHLFSVQFDGLKHCHPLPWEPSREVEAERLNSRPDWAT